MRTAPARTVAGLAALLIALVTGLTGCSGSKAEPKADPATVLAAAKKRRSRGVVLA